MLRSCWLVIAPSKQRSGPALSLLSTAGQRHNNPTSSAARCSSSDARVQVPLQLPSVCVWGANTGVGKSLISAGLVAAAVRNKVPVQYIKPVQTGYPEDSDARLVAAAAAATAGEQAAQQYLAYSGTLVGYRDPVSPHLAAATEQRVVADAAVVAAVAQQMREFVGKQQQQQQGGLLGLSVVETAGGVTSPGPSGSLQGDIYRPLALPALLVGDPALGGISTTLSAYESLLLRGAAVHAVAMMTEGRYNNVTAVRQHLQHAAAHRLGKDLPVLSLPLCKPPPAGSSSGSSSGGIDAELAAWLSASAPAFDQLLSILQQHHQQQLAWLHSAAGRASATVWWPFTQHAQLPNKDVTVVEARSGEDWLVFQQQQQQQGAALGAADSTSSSSSSGSGGAVLAPLHDAASSWWTQTAATPQLQLEVCRAVAAAAGRYMHVMWPQVAHAPGLALTEALLQGPLGAGWASRVFFSDDGSTAVEVGLKMAFRKFLVDQGLTAAAAAGDVTLQVLALHNSYHGDTLGAMDCAAASPFNGPLQTPWYSGRGLFMDPPYMAIVQGNWTLRRPQWLQAVAGSSGGGSGQLWSLGSRQEAFDVDGRSSSHLATIYQQHIEDSITAHEAAAGSSGSSGSSRRRLGALLMEPVLQGAGGMLLPDPLFQAELVQAARRRGIPVIYDEVFTGCWRLGPPTAGLHMLGQAPDIACYAKLLTGGVAPLAVTLSTEAVFDAFKGDSKVEALLHGHSYTAYPVGCAAAAASLEILQNPALNPNICTPHAPGRCRKQTGVAAGSSSSSCCSQPCGELLPLWDESAAAALSHNPRVAGVVLLGSVLAVELAAGGAGAAAGRYGSAAAVDVVAWLRERGVAARPLGPVVYMMATPTSSRGTCDWLLRQLAEVLSQDEAVWAAAAVARGGDAEGVLI